MDPSELVLASAGLIVPYIAKAPVAAVPRDRSAHVLCTPVLRRPGGFLLALPTGSVPPSLLAAGAEPDAQGMHGPSTTLEVPAAEEDEVGGERLLEGESLSVLLVDLDDSAAAHLEPYDQDAGGQIIPFDPVHPDRFPDVSTLLQLTRAWCRSMVHERASFYTAAEEEGDAHQAPLEGAPAEAEAAPDVQAKGTKPKRVTTAQLQGQLASLLEVMPRLTGQLEQLTTRQQALEDRLASRPAEAAAPSPNAPPDLPLQRPFVFPRPKTGPEAAPSVFGPPPRGRPAPNDTPQPGGLPLQPVPEVPAAMMDSEVGAALTQQSNALTMLVSHFIAQASEGSGDFGIGTPGASALSSKGSAPRGARHPLGSFHGGCGSVGFQADESYLSSASVVGGPQGHASPFQVHGVCREVWRLPVPAGPWPHPVYAVPDCGPPVVGGGRGDARPDILDAGGCGAGGAGPREMGRGLCAVPFPGPSRPALYQQGCLSESAPEGLGPFVSGPLGDDSLGLPQGGRRHHGKAVGGHGLRPRSTQERERGAKEASPKAAVPKASEGRLLGQRSQPGVQAGASFQGTPLVNDVSPPAGRTKLHLDFLLFGFRLPPGLPLPGLAAAPARTSAPFDLGSQHPSHNSVQLEAPEERPPLPRASASLPEHAQGSFKPAAARPQDPTGGPGPSADRLTFRRWSLSFCFRILRTRTPFSAFLASLLHLTQVGMPPPAKSLFPLPLPYFGLFRSSSPRLNSRARLRLGVRRATFVTVAALNYVHSGGFVHFESLRRPPNSSQRKALDYLERLVKACGAVESVHVPSASRRSAQLIARLSEISDQMTRLGPVSDPYGPAFPGVSPSPAERRAALSPYQSLCADRLKLSGKANWDPTPFLEDSLYLAFREPQSLLLPQVPEPSPSDIPSSCPTPAAELEKVARLWDRNGLLVLCTEGPPPERPYEGVRLFNAAKSSTTDRQIADRRGRNWVEGTIAGPSRELPTGVALSCLCLRPAEQTLSICVTDRKDYYHQLMVPPRRSLRNVLVPPVATSKLRDTQSLPGSC